MNIKVTLTLEFTLMFMYASYERSTYKLQSIDLLTNYNKTGRSIIDCILNTK